MKNRRISLMLALVFAVNSLSGCGSFSAGEKQAAGGEIEEEENTESEKTVVTFQTWNPTDMGPESPIHQIIAEFERANPDIAIKYEYIDSRSYGEYIKVGLMAGEGADIYAVQPGMAYRAFRDYQENLTPYCRQAWGEAWREHFVESAIDVLTVGEDVYGVPLGISYAGTAWADVGMLERYNLTIPDSYDKLLAASEVLRSNGEMPLAIGAKDDWINIDTWMSIAADVDAKTLYQALEGEAAFTEPAIVESFQIWQDCFETGIFQDDAVNMTLYNDVNDRFQRKGTIPMILNGSWALNMFTLADEETRANFDGADAEHTIFLIDWNNDGEYRSLTTSVDVTLCLNNESEVKEEAFRFMQYLVDCGQEILVNQYLEYLPSVADMEVSVRGVSKNGKECLSQMLAYCECAQGMRGISYGKLQEVIEDNLEALARGTITPQEAAGQIQTASEQIERE